MPASVDAALMALRHAEEAFEFEIVPRAVRNLLADEEPGLEGVHGFGHGPAEGQGRAVELFLECAE